MFDEDAWGIVGLGVLLTIIIVAVVASFFLLPAIAIVVFVVGSIYAYFHSPGYLEKQAQKQTYELYEQAQQYQPYSRLDFSTRVISKLGTFPSQLANPIDELNLTLFDQLNFGDVTEPPPVCNSIEGARYRDRLSAFMAQAHTTAGVEVAIDTLASAYRAILDELPRIVEQNTITTVPISDVVDDLPEIVERFILSFYVERTEGLFTRLKARFDENYTKQKEVMPSEYKGDDLLWDYLGGTPVLDLFSVPVPIALPLDVRFEHSYVIAQSGHGKTTLLEYLISRDLAEDCCVVVIDSQRQLIPKLTTVDLHPDDIGWITPHHPLALNLFAFGQGGRDATVRVELLKFVLAGLMEVPLTPKQDVIFNFAIQLMFAIPNATIHTFLQLLTDPTPLEPHIRKLSGTVREFYETQFTDDRLYRDTKREISWRIWSLLKNPVFASMFGATENRVDMETELRRKLVLIDTDADFLQSGSAFFGRFFIAMILHEAQHRFQGRHRPAYVYLDEAHEVIDDNIDRMLAQARKARIGVTLSHQYIDQIDSPKTIQSVLTNTSTKFVGSVAHKDARTLAPELRTTPEFFRSLRKGTFATFIKGATKSAISLNVPWNALAPFSGDEDTTYLTDEMIVRYAPSEEQVVEGESFTMRDAEPPPKDTNSTQGDDDVDVGTTDRL